MSEQYRFRKDKKKVLGAGEYSVDNDEIGSLVYSGLFQGDEIVALLVSKFDEDATKRLLDRGDFMVRACNAHELLVEALNDARELLALNGITSDDTADYGSGRADDIIGRMDAALIVARTNPTI